MGANCSNDTRPSAPQEPRWAVPQLHASLIQIPRQTRKPRPSIHIGLGQKSNAGSCGFPAGPPDGVLQVSVHTWKPGFVQPWHSLPSWPLGADHTGPVFSRIPCLGPGATLVPAACLILHVSPGTLDSRTFLCSSSFKQKSDPIWPLCEIWLALQTTMKAGMADCQIFLDSFINDFTQLFTHASCLMQVGPVDTVPDFTGLGPAPGLCTLEPGTPPQARLPQATGPFRGTMGTEKHQLSLTLIHWVSPHTGKVQKVWWCLRRIGA